ncbi:PLP-dependent aminotransferase family protein [Paracoccus sp. DMF-8]|uniref:MocR-like pyridoxine biosynthesis transcription factor PdxR n=1 Tax=Paracoccus sp. DMF-8 TaxID=3019445 RepID=UPI0023E3C5BB|nr:PLP-dependent aminotransferase family protein [Paracoccus sp. DMF-8]MDF3607939.1 PLP-dependent aminotransferase family protein [Paracoccus sp. DMF-8]
MTIPATIPAENFFLDRASPAPLQVQLRRQIIAGVLQGRFRAGERLPSSRRLARHLGVARVTVTQAFAELVATEYLTSKGRSGHFIADEITPLPDAPAAPQGAAFDWSPRLDLRFTRLQRRDRVQDWRRFRFPFVYGQADPELVDHNAWRDCAVRALGRREFAALTGDLYDHDDPELLDYLARHILPRRGIRAEPDQIVLTLGAQNALWLVAEILLARGGRAAIEDPCYPGLREILSHTRAEILPLSVDAQGLPVTAIPPGTTAVFTTASHQCPTGTTMPLPRRHALLARALDQGFAIVEDDYEFEMSFAGAPSPALKGMDQAEAVIYIGSFSKSVFPGLRLGYIVADPGFIHEARALRGLTLRHPPGMLQRTLFHFLSLGHYDAQLNRMRRAYAERRAVMLRTIGDTGLSLASNRDTGGSSLWLQAPPGTDMTETGTALRDQSVLIEPGRPFFATPEDGRSHYRLAWSSISADLIEEGIRRIAGAVGK